MSYIDTSVLVAYYCPEPISEIVEETILRIEGPAISPLTEIEFFSAVSRKIREKTVSRSDVHRIINRFQSHTKNKMFRWIPVENQHYQMAKNWIAQFTTPLRTFDALHLAIAALNNLTLITADSNLAESAEYFGVDTTIIPP